MKKVYAVYHYWDNGEWGEDYRNYEDCKLFSNLDYAERHYWFKTYGDYAGCYEIIEWTLDYNIKSSVRKSPWKDCPDYLSTLTEDHDDYDDYDYSYHDWFHDTFMHDYDLALLEVEKKESYEQWILKQARNAARSNIDMSRAWWAFLNKYPLTLAEQSIFWDEYYTTKY